MSLLGVAWLAILYGNPAILEWIARKTGLLGMLCAGPVVWILPIVLGKLARRTIRLSAGRLSGDRMARTGIRLATCTVLVALVLGGIATVRANQKGWTISWTSVMRTHMRDLSFAIEKYYVDHNMYPAWAMGDNGPAGTWSFNYWIARESAKGNEPWAHLPTFVFCGDAVGRKLATLTTPTVYLGGGGYPLDIFAPARDATFVYWCIFPGQPDPAGKIVGKDSPIRGGVGWILVSPGPDRCYDIPGDWDVYDPTISQPSRRLLAGTNKKGKAFTYDPTNGAISSGDLWRVKQ